MAPAMKPDIDLHYASASAFFICEITLWTPMWKLISESHLQIAEEQKFKLFKKELFKLVISW